MYNILRSFAILVTAIFLLTKTAYHIPIHWFICISYETAVNLLPEFLLFKNLAFNSIQLFNFFIVLLRCTITSLRQT